MPAGARIGLLREKIVAEAADLNVQALSAEELQLQLDRIVLAACSVCLRKEQTCRAKRQSWWTADLAEQRRKVRRARERYQLARRRSFGGVALTPERTRCRL